MRLLPISKAGTILLSVLLISTTSTLGQTVDEASPKSTPIKFDEIGSPISDCELGQRYAKFFGKLFENPNYQGYVINYEGLSSMPGQSELNRRERIILNRVAYRNFDRPRITLVRGGYRQEGATELWLIPPKAENPEPSKTISDKLPPEGFSETTAFLYAERRNVISSHEDDFMLDSIREERAAERRDDDEPTIIPGSERDISDDDSNETDAERIKREEESRFRWVDLGIAERMANRKGSIGVIFFYADDKRFDIRKLQSFVEMGRDVLARHRPVVKNRFEIRYGGYREDPEVAFWFVPANAVAPMPQPFERCR